MLRNLPQEKAIEIFLDFAGSSRNLVCLRLDNLLNIISYNGSVIEKVSPAQKDKLKHFSAIVTPDSLERFDEAKDQEMFKIRLEFVFDNLLPEIFMATVYKLDEGWFLIAEISTFTSSEVLNQITILNNELANINRQLVKKNRQLEEAQKKIKMLSGLIPICSYCKKIRDDAGFWNQLESYITQNSEAVFSHGICPNCCKEHFPDLCEEELPDGDESEKK